MSLTPAPEQTPSHRFLRQGSIGNRLVALEPEYSSQARSPHNVGLIRIFSPVAIGPLASKMCKVRVLEGGASVRLRVVLRAGEEKSRCWSWGDSAISVELGWSYSRPGPLDAGAQSPSCVDHVTPTRACVDTPTPISQSCDPA